MQEEISEAKKFLNERSDKQRQINMKLISQTSLDAGIVNSMSEDEKIEVIIRLKSIHLQWLNIQRIQNLQVFEDLNILYLQHNNIRKIEGLQHLKKLQYLALNNNHISKIEGIKQLKNLLGLNLNYNEIQQLDTNELPQNLQLLSFINNPVCMDNDYKVSILKRLKFIEVLDDQPITPVERFKVLGIFPQKLMGYSSQIKQFYTKRQIKTKLVEENKPVLLNSENINEKQALNQIRTKTRKYLHQNQQTFKNDLKEQIDNFEERIKVSKKIRSIKEKEQADRRNRLDEIKSTTMNELMKNYK